METEAQKAITMAGTNSRTFGSTAPRDHGWKVLTRASERQAEALKQALDEGRDFATDADLDNFLKEHK